jgi:hypothetical protein
MNRVLAEAGNFSAHQYLASLRGLKVGWETSVAEEEESAVPAVDESFAQG